MPSSSRFPYLSAGLKILHVVAGEIACVEVLDRSGVPEKLDAVLPSYYLALSNGVFYEN
jgi:hypothetical protein